MYIFEHVSIVLTLCALEEILNKFKLVNTILVFFLKVILWKEKKKFKESIKYIYANFCPQLWEKSFYKHKNDQTKFFFHLATPVIT